MQSLFNPNDGITGRDGGPYLDEAAAHLAEKRRARVEGREPEAVPGPDSGIPLVNATAAFAVHGVVNTPSQAHRDYTASPEAILDAAVKNEDSLLQPRGFKPDVEVSKTRAGKVTVKQDTLPETPSNPAIEASKE